MISILQLLALLSDNKDFWNQQALECLKVLFKERASTFANQGPMRKSAVWKVSTMLSGKKLGPKWFPVIFTHFYKEKGKRKTYLIRQTKEIEAHRHYGTSKDIEDSNI